MSLLTWTSLPVLILPIWLALELLDFAPARVRGSVASRACLWFFRPLAGWAFFNIVFRFFEPLGFNNRRTFPFYYGEWVPGESWTQAIQRLRNSPSLLMWTFVVLLLALVLLYICQRIMTSKLSVASIACFLAALSVMGFAVPLAFDALPDGARDPLENKGSFLHEWFDYGGTLLYCMPEVEGVGRFVRHFEMNQPDYDYSIHGVSHPPGAILSLYWAGRMFGATERPRVDRLRYQLGNTLVSSLCVIPVFLLGFWMTTSSRTGLLCAVLWSVKPATISFNTFAGDGIYNIFFILCLALSWRVTVQESRPWMSMLLLGCTFYSLSMLNFNWPMLVGMFCVFLLINGLYKSMAFQEIFWRGTIPVLFSLLALSLTCIYFGMNYFNILFCALRYHQKFYDSIATLYGWTMSLIGAQLDLYLLSGCLCASIFAISLAATFRKRPFPSAALFLVVVLGVHFLISAFVSNALKMESSRVWAWITAIPLVFVADWIIKSDRPRAWLFATVGFSLLQNFAMRLFLFARG